MKIDAKSLDKAIDKYIVLYLNEKFVGKIKSVNHEEHFVVIEQLGGKDDGKIFKCPYDPSAVNIEVYEKDEAVIALLD